MEVGYEEVKWMEPVQDRINSWFWLHLQALGSIFIASYDLQGYGGGIRTHLHMGNSQTALICAAYNTSARTAQEIPLLCSYLWAAA
jgi:hypothetical protein